MVGQFGSIINDQEVGDQQVRVVENCVCTPSLEISTGGGWTPFGGVVAPGPRLTDPTPGGGHAGPWTDRAQVIRANLRPVSEGGVLRRLWWQQNEWDAWRASEVM
jgi:hypothetical protein